MEQLTFEEACLIVSERRSSQSALIRQMAEVANRYNGDYVIPVELDERGEATRPVVTPSLIVEAVDNPALLASGVDPMIFCAPLDVTKDTGVRSKDYARRRSQALRATYAESKWGLLKRRLFRQIAGYGVGAPVIMADDEKGLPRIVLRNPLTAFPEPRAPEDICLPGNCGFVVQHSAEYLRVKYPAARAENGGPVPPPTQYAITEMWDVLEWIDEHNVMLGIMGPSKDPINQDRLQPFLLHTWPNRAGRCTAVIPTAITLDKIQSRLVHMTGIVDIMAYLTDLDILATRKSVFPDRFAVAAPQGTPRIVSHGGKWVDGETGDINLLAGISQLGELRGTPDPMNKRTIADLERSGRLAAGLVAAQAGETYGALRTGRGIDSLMAVSVDPRIAEMHAIMAATMVAMNEAMFLTYEGYYGAKQYTLFCGSATIAEHVEFTPSQHMKESHTSVVEYAIPGADAGALTIEAVQLSQSGLASVDTARRLHPHISDPDGEARRVLAEQIDQMVMSSIQQRAMGGGLTPVDAATIKRLIVEGNSLEAAVIEADRIARERQATEAPPAPEGMAVPPETMPGIAQPGEGAESQPPAGGPGPAGALDPAQFLAALAAAPGAAAPIPA